MLFRSPDYDIYVKRMKAREKKEKALAKKITLEEKKAAEEQAKMTEEFEKVDLDTTFNKKVEEKIKKKIEWESPK